MFCPNCGSEVAEGRRFCGKCGRQIGSGAPEKCPGCGAEIPVDAAFCGECGLRLKNDEPGKSAAPAASSASQPAAPAPTPAPRRSLTLGQKLTYALAAVLIVLGGVAWWWFHRPAPAYKVQDPGVYPFQDVGADGKTLKWGFIDADGKVLIQPQWDDVSRQFVLDQVVFFNEGLCAVKKDGKWGYIDQSGNLAVPAQFDQARPLVGGIAAVALGNQWGFIDKTGKYLINPQFDSVGDFHDGLAAAQKSGKWGFIDRSGNFRIRSTFDAAAHNGFVDGLAWVVSDGKAEYIDRSGRVVIRPQFESVWDFSEGLASVALGGKLGFINMSGKLVVNPQFESVSEFHGGRAIVAVSGRQGVIDKTGKYVVNPGQYSIQMLASHDLMQVTTSDGVGLMNWNGAWVIPPSKAVAQFDLPLGKVIYAQFQGQNGGALAPVSMSGKVLAGAYKGAPLGTLAQDVQSEAGTVLDVQRLMNAEAIYASRFPAQGFTTSFTALGPGANGASDADHAGMIDAPLTSGTADNYQFTIVIPEGASAGGASSNYLLTAKPAAGHYGRTLCGDSSRTIHYSTGGQDCTMNSPTL